ncbi:DNA-binding protein [Halohasta salina]|uniref:DNA-binding protein n=1 Tax=Halohasta salina TaxID=2961621 RepID=UPI0020A4B8F0|nr:DNA-binding protein [Halohasta salina]
MTADPGPETRIPETETPVVCPYCGFELPDDEQCRLHVGLEHYGELGEAEREAFKRSYTEEEAELNRFRIVALGALVALYFGFLVVYALLAV